MKETMKHLDAFEEYVRLGVNRSYKNLGKKLGVSHTSVNKWGVSFNWQDRVRLRDIENSKQIAKKTDKTVVATKANFRKDINDSLQIIRDTIMSALDPVTGILNIKTKTANDINALAAAYEKLAKLDLLLVGENTSSESLTINVDIEPVE